MHGQLVLCGSDSTLIKSTIGPEGIKIKAGDHKCIFLNFRENEKKSVLDRINPFQKVEDEEEAMTNNNNNFGTAKVTKTFSERATMLKGKNIGRAGKKSSERTLREVLKLISEWRRIHKEETVVVDPTTQTCQRISLAQAAQKLGISKKSLDDYYMNLKYASSFGFNFNENLDIGFGLVRSFVKKYKNVHTARASDADEEEEDDESTTLQKLQTENLKLKPTASGCTTSSEFSAKYEDEDEKKATKVAGLSKKISRKN
jgi:hypothetical protein